MKFLGDTFEDQALDTAIDLTPLIDVVFLLLIFFMVTTTFADARRITVELPGSEHAEQSLSEKSLLLALDRDGQLYVDAKKMSLAELRQYLTQDTRPAIIWADKSAPHGRVVEILDLASSGGKRAVSIATVEAEAK